MIVKFHGFKDPFFMRFFLVKEEDELFEKCVGEMLPDGEENRTEVLSFIERFRKAGSDHSGCYYKKNDNTDPSSMGIIEGLQF